MRASQFYHAVARGLSQAAVSGYHGDMVFRAALFAPSGGYFQARADRWTDEHFQI